MIPKELIKKIKRLDIKTKLLVDEMFSGEYHSIFKGRGIEFSEVREYAYGDDVRIIDWNVTARFGKPFVKVYEEERELTVLILFDISSSTLFGSQMPTKRDCMIEIAALFAFSAVENNDQVGAVLFSDSIENYIPPKKDRTHALRVLRELVYYKSSSLKTNLKTAFDFANTVPKRKSIVIVLSDFFDSDYEKSFRLMTKRHDVIPIMFTDPFELNIAETGGIISMHDIEGGGHYHIDLSDSKTREEYKRRILAGRLRAKKLFISQGIDYIEVSIDKPYINPLFEFFQRRARRL
ncbi:MAG: DUF58 domain-containing protein [Spirochaetota bacterium]|nr:MAG: DUF58 domain-containing protein [Spirochaetota bacterium]